MNGQNQYPDANGPIPRPNVQAIASSLRDGRLNIPTALGQISAVISETLTAVEEFALEEAKLNQDRKSKLDKLNKIISDLSEKCQGMQQALLFKEEKYDEKCREVARYKVICEMSAKAVVGENQYYHNDGEASNNPDYNDIYGSPDRKDGLIKEEPRRPDTPGSQAQNMKAHMKLSNNQLHLSHYVNPLRPASSKSNPCGANFSDYDSFDQHSTVSNYYAGGPCRRKIPINDNSLSRRMNSRIKERMETIGGINIRGPQIDAGPVMLERLINRSTGNDDINKRVKIDLTSQRNEVMSSSGNLAQQTRQRIVEKDLHKQVAGGCWTRLANRRKKDWPF